MYYNDGMITNDAWSYALLYLSTFIEGVATFISPCLLPMLPVYISYFANGESKAATLRGSLLFVAGFACVFALMGAFASSLGMLLAEYQTALNLVTGGFVMLMGFGFLGLLPFSVMGASSGRAMRVSMPLRGNSFFSFVFGMAFAVSWTPCVGTFLGAALMTAANRESMGEGVALLLCYSAGLGIPLIASALMIEKLKSAFDFIKRNYRVINIISGCALIATGALMAAGVFWQVFRF